MIDLNKIKRQLEQAKSLAETAKKENVIFDKVLQETMKGVSEAEKPEIEKIIALAQRSINLAKKGKLQESQDMIQKFKTNYGGKSNQ